ncbi:MAG: restriction endonuclease [Nitrospirae bacterium]|nr:restriction endonuclease [Nitrospirota bacterium]
MKKLDFQTKEKLISLSGACFWYWGSFYKFLDSCGVPKSTVNRYPKESFNKYQVMENVLSDLEKANKPEIIESIISNFFQMQNALDKDKLDTEKAKTLLHEFRELVKNDPIEREIQKRQVEQNKEKSKKENEERLLKSKKIDELKEKFNALHQNKNNAQKRGFEFEKLFFEILDIEQFECRKPFKNKNEQIDGFFKYEKFDYLVELKWETNSIKQDGLSIFDGKINGKLQSTRGFFLAVNGFDQNAIDKFSGHSPKIILMDGQDLMSILDGRITFFDCLKSKIDALVRRGEILSRII